MEREVIDKIVQLLKSEQTEMCSLALSMFTSDKYEDYFIVRTLYNSTDIFLDRKPARMALRGMWEKVRDDVTIGGWHKLCEKHKFLINKTKTNGTQE